MKKSKKTSTVICILWTKNVTVKFLFELIIHVAIDILNMSILSSQMLFIVIAQNVKSSILLKLILLQ